MNKPELTRSAVGMGAATAVSRAFGFLRVLTIAAVLGTTFLGNAFQSANSLSNVVFELVAAGALSAVLVPTFVSLLDRSDDDEVDRLAGVLLGYAVIVLGALSIVGIICAPLIARVLSSGVAEPAVAAEQRALSTFLLRWFIPQIVLYAFAAVATALLYARRRFAITAAAPIGNTIVMVGALIAFRAVAGSDPTLVLSTGERYLLVVAGTGGVFAFVGILVFAARRSGFSLRPRRPSRDPAVHALLVHSGWGALLNANAGLLLGAAIIAGNAVEGGVVAYQVAFVFFLAPYAILAQPLHTTVLPELTLDAEHNNGQAFGEVTRWALDRMALLLIPVSAVMIALALPVMRAIAFGRVEGSGVALLAGALASLAIGLYPYSTFLLLARAYYALGDSRTPAIVSVISAVGGIAVIVIAAPLTHGAARVAVLGIGHSVAYLVGAVVLGIGCSKRIGVAVVPRALPAALSLAVPLGLAAWLTMRTWDPESRVETIGVLALIGAVGGAIYLAGLRVLAPASRPPAEVPAT